MVLQLNVKCNVKTRAKEWSFNVIKGGMTAMKKLQSKKGKGVKVIGVLCILCLTFLAVALLTKWFVQDAAPKLFANISSYVDGDNIKEADYKDTIEEALVGQCALTTYQQKIDEELFRMRKGDRMCIYYRATKEDEESFVMANLRIMEREGKEKYACASVSVATHDEKSTNFNERIAKKADISAADVIVADIQIATMSFINSVGESKVDNSENDRMVVYGNVLEVYFAEDESIYNLRIDGKAPDEIVEYESFGATYYFWYYSHLDNAGAITADRVTLTEEDAKVADENMATTEMDEMIQEDVTTENHDETQDDEATRADEAIRADEATGSGSGTEMSVEEQIDIFAKGVEQWSNNGDQTIWFAVADMNMDNQLELITDSIQGSGRFAYNEYYVVDTNGSMKALEQEERFGLYLSTYYPSEDGVIAAPVYYDVDNTRYYSIQGTGVRGTPTSFRYSLCGLWIENEAVKEEYLGSRQHDTEDVYGEWTITYEDAEGNVITEEEFDTLAKKKFSGLQEMQMIWKWQTVPLEELQGISEEDVEELLMDSYNNFTIQEIPIG